MVDRAICANSGHLHDFAREGVMGWETVRPLDMGRSDVGNIPGLPY